MKGMVEIATFIFAVTYASVWHLSSPSCTTSEGLNNILLSVELSRVHKKYKVMVIKAGVALADKYLADKLVLLSIV